MLCSCNNLLCASTNILLPPPIAFTPAITKVPPPTDIQLLFINLSSVRISWKYPSGDDTLSIGFLVRVSHDGDPYQDASRLLKQEKVFVFDKMLFSGYYQFLVVAYFEGVASEPAVTDYFINGVTGKGSSQS